MAVMYYAGVSVALILMSWVTFRITNLLWRTALGVLTGVLIGQVLRQWGILP